MQGTQEVHFVAITDKGIRQVNADAVYADKHLFIVADGVGTGKNSGLASKMSVTRISECCKSGDDLATAIAQAHLSLKQFNQQNPTEQPAGTTVVAATLVENQWDIAWVGDSRAYLVDLSKQHIELLTQDHSLVNKLVERGDITRDQARSHPQRNVITRCLGLTQQNELATDVHAFGFGSNQILLLCSDGLSGSLSDEKILGCLQQSKSLDELAEELLQMALRAGSRDNISLVLVAESEAGQGY